MVKRVAESGYPMTASGTASRELGRVRKCLARLEMRKTALVTERDALIRGELAAGRTLREVACMAGLSHGAIALIRDAAPVTERMK